MHGVIFTSLRDYVTAEYGPETVDQVFTGEPVYLLSQAYDDERFFELIRRTCGITGRETDDVLYEFGIFTAGRTFTRLYPAFFALEGSARQFMLTVEKRIHELVRATLPRAEPPRLRITELDDDGISIVYESPRQLCPLLRGLTEGAALHYAETASIDEPTCMRRGDAACTFEVRFSAASPLA